MENYKSAETTNIDLLDMRTKFNLLPFKCSAQLSFFK